MEKTFFLGNSPEFNKLGETIAVPQLQSEAEIHNWVVSLFKDNDIDKIGIEISAESLIGIEIAYHIRLSIEQLKEKCLLPIFFISHQSMANIIGRSGLFAQLLPTSGVFFSAFDVNAIKIEIENIFPLRENEYLTNFLKKIHIVPDETIGRHSLGNIWGAYILDKVSNANSLPKDVEFKKKLYFKYITAFNNLGKLKPSRLKTHGTIEFGNVNNIKSEGKRILLIDDEADKGWTEVLQNIFKTSSADDFVVINEKVKDFESLTQESKDIFENQIFDLYLVDLRLNGTDEDENLNPSQFSGVKILKKIKSINEGFQVIMFSASNKIWNLKTLLNEGADGYYLKESPEFSFPIKVSEQNYADFQQNVLACYQREYLREIYQQMQNTLSANSNPENRVIEESATALDIAWNLIKGNETAFGFLSLFQFIETYANHSVIYEKSTDKYCLSESVLISAPDFNKREWEMTFYRRPEGDYFSLETSIQEQDVKPTALFNISAMLYFKYNKPADYLRNFGRLNKIRNGIAHGKVKTVFYGDILELLKIIQDIRTNL